MRYRLKLYVVSQTPNSIRALANLKSICEAELNGEYEITVIDILKETHLADEDRIVATPTLVKELPPPLRKIIGDLSDREKVLLGLNLMPTGRPGAQRAELVAVSREGQ